MRCFVAAPLPKEVKDHLYDVQKEIGSSDAKIAWVPKSQMHLTLKFLGHIKERKKIQEALAKVKHDKITLTLTKLGRFKHKDRQVLFVSVQPPEELRKLAFAVDEATIDISNDKPFKAHITLGRVKKIKFPEAYEEKLENVEIEPLEFTIDKFQLVRSKLTASGARHTVIDEYKL